MAAAVLTGGLAPVTAQPIGYTNDELIAGFNATVFGSETTASDAVASLKVKKFVGPIPYKLVLDSRHDRRETVRLFLEKLETAVENLDFREVSGTAAAALTVYIVDRAQYHATIRETAWPGVDTAFLEGNACSAVIAARTSGIERAVVYLVGDEGFLSFAHCMVEEILQSLGPANDSNALIDSIFNDTSSLNVFGVFDWFVLSMLYDDRVRPGMTFEEVQPILPAAIADARQRLPAVIAATGALRHDKAR